MEKSPKKPITKRKWFWPVVGVVAISAIAGGGGDKEDQKQTPVEPNKSVVQVDTSDRAIPVDVSEPIVDKSANTSTDVVDIPTQPAKLEPQEPAAEPEPQKPQKSTEVQEPDNQQSRPETQEPEQNQTPEPDPVVTPDPPKNTNSAGKERRGTWASGDYMASAQSDKYHDYECRAAKNILPGNEIWFHSEEEAQAAGYSRCGICW